MQKDENVLNPKDFLKYLDWFKRYGDCAGLGGFCLVLELHWRGSPSNGDAPSICLTFSNVTDVSFDT